MTQDVPTPPTKPADELVSFMGMQLAAVYVSDVQVAQGGDTLTASYVLPDELPNTAYRVVIVEVRG